MSARKKVLVIDDDAAVAAFMLTKLKQHYNVITTVDARKATSIAREEMPDVILCDLDMPHVTGGEVAQMLSEDPVTARIPLIFLTSLVSPEEAKEMQNWAGGHLGMSKQAPLSELRARIDAAQPPVAPAR
jgi:CheY-like chemotaxis protein